MTIKATDFSVDNLTCMTDIHLHLDGAISLKSAKELALMQNMENPSSDDEILKLMVVSDDCRDLNEFLEKFTFPLSLLQSYDGLKKAVINLLAELKEQGVMYAEIRYAPQLHCTKCMSQEESLLAVLEGVNESVIDTNIILCCMRGSDNQKANMETVNLAEKYLGKGVCAIDIAGAEGIYPTKDFEYVCLQAKEKGIPFTIHAGEADGAHSVRCAIDFGALRIGHGVRSIEDEQLVKRLSEEKIPLEICLTSNINTAIYSSYSDNPLKKLADAGVVVTINTDDPAIEGTDIKNEYRKAMEAFGLTKEDVRQLLMNSVKASFASDDVKAKMVKEIDKQFG